MTYARFEKGMKFGRLTLIEKIEGEKWWNCKCDCGNMKIIKNPSTMKSGASTSCGCARSEKLKIDNPMFNPETAKKVSRQVRTSHTPEMIQKRAAAAQSEEAKEKRRNTNIAKYGGLSPMASIEVRNKVKNTQEKNIEDIFNEADDDLEVLTQDDIDFIEREKSKLKLKLKILDNIKGPSNDK